MELSIAVNAPEFICGILSDIHLSLLTETTVHDLSLALGHLRAAYIIGPKALPGPLLLNQ